MEKIKLRACVPEDSDFYYNVKKITLKEYVENTYGAWDERYQQERHKKNFSPNQTKVVQFQGIDVGILVIEEEGDSIMLHNIEILPEYQDQGIGTHLLKRVIEQAVNRGKNVSLQVFKSNPKAQKFYQRLGFLMETNRETETHFRMKYTL